MIKMKKKTYTLKPTKKQLEVMKKYWKFLQDAEEQFFKSVNIIEQDMQKATGIDDIEFFRCDGDYVGIGNVDKTMVLIQQNKLNNI